VPSSASLIAAVVALGCAVVGYGVGSLLQAMAARRYPHRSASRLLLSPLVLGGLALDVAGFFAAALALGELPLFFVQGATSASILVTALLAMVVLQERPTPREALALPLVLVGLVTLAMSAEPGPALAPPLALTLGLVVCVPVFSACGWFCVTHAGRASALGLAMLAGLSYGCASLTARGLSAVDHGAWRDLGLVLVAAHALQGVALVTVAMRRAPVNTVTSVLFATEAIGPAAIGLLLLGDRTAEGLGWAAVAGCLSLIGATVLLSPPAAAGPAASDETATGQAETNETGIRSLVPAPRSVTDRPGTMRSPGAHRIGRHRPRV
jgi:drug/metabolite transporter (DMT)-like permease